MIRTSCEILACQGNPQDLERRVLHQLRDRKEPVNWDELYVHFDLHRTGDMMACFEESTT